MGYLAPNLNHIIAMYVRKEALLSSQIEGTQATLEDIFEYENETPLKNANDVEEVVNYVKALNYGMNMTKPKLKTKRFGDIDAAPFFSPVLVIGSGIGLSFGFNSL